MNKQTNSRFPEKLLVGMSRDLRSKITEQAAKTGQSDSEFVRSAIRSAIAATTN